MQNECWICGTVNVLVKDKFGDYCCKACKEYETNEEMMLKEVYDEINEG